MVLRGAAWLAVLVALVAVMGQDRIAPDPPRTSAVAEGSWVMVFSVTHDWRVIGLMPRTTPHAAPLEIGAFASTPEKVRDARRFLEVVQQAADRQLLEPVELEIGVVPEIDLQGDTQPASAVAVFPIWDVAPHADLTGLHPAHVVDPVLFVEGAALVAPRSQWDLRDLLAAWRAEWTVPRTAPPPRDGVYMAFYATHFLHPFWDEPDSGAAAVESYLRGSSSERLLGGLLLAADAEDHGEVRGLLSDPAFIRLSHALRWGSLADRRSARHAALADDDPRIALFAAHDLFNRDTDELELTFVPDLLLAWPHRNSDSWDFEVDYPAERIIESLPPDEAAHEVARVLRTTVDADRLKRILTVALDSKSRPAVRRAALAGIVDRLPRHVLHFENPEREALVGVLVDRLRNELLHGDPKRAVDVAADAATLCFYGHLPEGSPARSRLLEFTCQLVFDPQWGERFRLRPQATLVTLRELLRNSDPEVRRAACILVMSAGLDDHPLAGDPFCADLAERFKAMSSGANQKAATGDGGAARP